MEHFEWWQVLIIIITMLAFTGFLMYFVYLIFKKQEDWFNKRVYHISLHIDNAEDEDNDKNI